MSRTDYWREYYRRRVQNPETREKLRAWQRQKWQRHSFAIKVSRALGVPMHEARKLIERTQ